MIKVTRFDKILIAAGALLSIVRVLFAYVSGFQCNPAWELFSMPTIFLLLLLMVISLVMIFVRFFKRKGDALAAMLTLGILIVIFYITPANAPVFLKGFQSFVLSRYSAVVLQEKVAKLSSQIPQSDILSFADPSTKEGREWEEVLTLEFPEFYKSKVKPHLLGNQGGVVKILWGGALTGHWGIIYSSDAVQRSPEDFSFIPVTKKLALTYLNY